MGRYIEMQHASAIVSQDKECEQESKADSRNHEEIDGYHLPEMILKRCTPGLRRRPKKLTQSL